MSNENLTEYMQENILNLLIQDDSSYKLIIPYIKSKHFESFYYRKIYQRVSFFILRFKRCPKKHVYDLLDKEIREDNIYKEIIDNIFNQTVNAEYVISNFKEFSRLQQLKLGITSVAEHLEHNNIEEAEKSLSKLKKDEIEFFDKGSTVDTSFLDEDQRDIIPTGIEPLDEVGATPAKGELYSLIALPNMGKSQFLIHMGKIGMMTRRKVLHISLEMSEARVKQRYVQSFFNVTKKKGEILVNELEIDEYGYLNDISQKKFNPKFTFYDTKNIQDILNKKLSKLPLKNLIIKQFPSGSLTTQGLRNYIENLIDYENFHPDMIMLDYPAKMDLNPKFLREELRKLYIDFRGMAVEYNFAAVIVAQINREPLKDKTIIWLDEGYLQEDFSLKNEADYIVSYNQTPYEYEKKLARLYLTKARDDVRNLKILISQNYKCCQFALDSALLKKGLYKIEQGD